jgi:prepilin-type N-terminal cleavage/methylation domain-containing protein
MRHCSHSGFTLIELSIVLIIIGLIVGGVLAGQDLIRAAEERATIAQIEKYNTAVNTFRGKYGYLPGDIKDPDATNFGLSPRGLCSASTPCYGEGDGNGVIEGVTGGGAGLNTGLAICTGENGLFWIDLTTANGLNLGLIDGSFSSAQKNAPFPGTPTSAATILTVMGQCEPAAKLGRSNYIYVYSSGGINYWGMSVPTQLQNWGALTANPGVTVRQAYDIDSKMDDGVPLGGNVQVQYVHGLSALSVSSGHSPATSADCYDSTTTTGAYALATSSSIVNCALSFQFQ